jgi:hypothetical protein
MLSKVLKRFWLEGTVGALLIAVGVCCTLLIRSQPGSLRNLVLSVSARLPGSTAYTIDAISRGGSAVDGTARYVTLNSGETLTLDGWAVDTPNKTAASSVVAQVDDVARVGLSTLGPRPDVANALNNWAYEQSAFSIVIPPQLLPPGKHTVLILVGDGKRSGFYVEPDPLEVVVSDRPWWLCTRKRPTNGSCLPGT